MIFKYDQNKYNIYFKNYMKIWSIFYIFLLSLLILYLYIMTKDYKITLIIITIIIGSSIFGILIGYIKGKGVFISFEIECNEKNIIIKGLMMFNRNIEIINIKKIIKDNKNNIYIILNKINRIEILPYIENITEFEKYLSNIMPIEQNNIYNRFYIYQDIPEYLRIIPIITIFGFSNLISIIQSFILFTLLIIISIYSSVRTCMNYIKLRNKIIVILINIFMIYNENK